MKYLSFLFFSLLSPYALSAQEMNIKLSDDLELIQIAENIFIHKSFTNSEKFGRYSSNGLVYINNGQALIADTPPSIEQSEILLNWIVEKKIEIKAVVVNHYHSDALGGLEVFKKQHIPSYGFVGTSSLAKKHGFISLDITFSDSVLISIGNENVEARFFGEAHTSDNITLWIPETRVLFGGCMIKSLKSGKGNLADANTSSWSGTVQKVKDHFSEVNIVVPGHGNHGSIELLDYTIKMFLK